MALTLGVTAAGALVGGYFGNPMLGAQLGMMAGSIAGALLFPGGEDSKGPRLGDLRVGDASYGVSIPIVYGSARVAGNMLWTSGLEERSTEESMKGGGPTSTTYAYYSSFAIGLCEGPLATVRKIWLDTKLVYDMSSTNLGITNQRTGDMDPRGLLDADELADRGDEIQAELASVQSALTIYLGTETQLPDPVMEAHEGVGQVPAHRGLAYLVFQDLPLAAYGNRIPNVSAEVMTVHATAYPKRTTTPSPATLQRDNSFWDAPRQKVWHEYQGVVTEVDALAGIVLRVQTIDTSAWGGTVQASGTRILEVDQDGALYLPISSSPNHGRVVRLDPISLAVTHVNVHLITLGPEEIFWPYTLVTSATYVWVTTTTLANDVHCFLRPGAINPSTGLPVTWMARVGSYRISTTIGGQRGQALCIDRDERAWVVCSASSVFLDQRTFLLVMEPLGVGTMIELTADLHMGDRIAYDAQTHSVLISGRVPIPSGVSGSPRLIRVDCATREVTAVSDASGQLLGYVASSWRRGLVGRQLWMGTGTSMVAIDVDSLTPLRTIPTTVGYPASGAISGGLYDPATNSMWVMESGVGFATYYFDRSEPEPVTLGAVVRDLSQRAGLAETDVLTGLLTAPVHGFVLAQRAETRAALTELLAAFLADGVETDWLLSFQHRAALPVATLTPDDLAAHEPGATRPDVLTPERLDDQQLPMRLDVTYADPARDYQDTVQHARRFQAGQRARSQREVRTPVLLSADQAKQLAEQSLAEAWVSRATYRLSVPYRWSPLDPGDVLDVDAGGHTALMRVQQIQHGANGVLEVSAVAYDRHIYIASPSIGVIADAPPAQTIPWLPPTALFLLDTHLLRDVDEGSGYYMAMAPHGSGSWSGATAFSSLDGDAWRMEDTITMAVDYGSAQTILEPGSPYVIDTAHTVDITMARGQLSSITEAELINGMNGGLLGNEIVQWQTATPIGTHAWRLSTLLRGRRGTEWAIADHHAGERFIVLSYSTLRREQMGLSEVDTTRLYRAVTMNTDALTTTGQAFANTALGLKPYSPEHLHGTRNASNDLTITWARRTRLGGLWVSGREVNIGEIPEAYEIDVLAGATVLRTLSSATPTVTYPASQQTTDGLTPGAPVTVTVYQLGQLGRGWPTTATV